MKCLCCLCYCIHESKGNAWFENSHTVSCSCYDSIVRRNWTWIWNLDHGTWSCENLVERRNLCWLLCWNSELAQSKFPLLYPELRYRPTHKAWHEIFTKADQWCFTNWMTDLCCAIPRITIETNPFGLAWALHAGRPRMLHQLNDWLAVTKNAR